jgi:uncharacterized protein YjbJ (UPF0337 family)
MAADIIKGNWKVLKGKIRQRWGKFTDDDVAQMQGSYDELEGRLQKLYGYQKEQAKKEIDAFLHENKLSEKV